MKHTGNTSVYWKLFIINDQKTYTWSEFGKTVPQKSGTVEVNGQTYSQLQCFLKAISLDKSNYTALVYLGEALGEKETIEINGINMDSRDCYIEALEISSNSFARAWNNLGTLLFPSETVEISGEIVTERECYIRAIQLFQDDLAFRGWLPITALETSSNLASAWSNLGALLAPGETAEINGEVVTKRDCDIRANEVVSSSASNLGYPIPELYPREIIQTEEDPVKTPTLRRRNVHNASSAQS